MHSKFDILPVLAIFISCVKSDGYSYPQPPFQFDEPSTPPPLYLPSPPLGDDVPQILVPTYLPPPVPDEILPPFEDGIVITAPPNTYLPPTQKQNPLQVINMSCLDSRDASGFFRAFLRSANRGQPVMETSSSECLITPLGSDTFKIDLEGHRMSECGIRACGVRMCLGLRMATVAGLRLAEDPLVTLQCTPQETIVSHTKHFKLNAHSEFGRSNSRSIAVASGGNQRKFDTSISLLRKSNGVFDQLVQQGSAVRLGDELMLRTIVKEGDGWKSSRMGTVIIRSPSAQRSLVLIDEHGCRNPTIRSVCPNHPQQVSPLVVQFPFRAFLFQGAAPADDLVLSVRMSACLRPRDCYQSKICEDNSRTRVARDAYNGTENAVTDWESQFAFRVLPKDVSEESGKSLSWMVAGVAGLSFVLGCCVFGFVVKSKRDDF